MDQLKAYRILGLENEASIEEVKEAYARLSKEYHPEENPEEFQQIHQAYITLTRRGRRGNSTVLVDHSPMVHHEENTRESELVFHKLPEYEEQEAEDDAFEYDFESTVRAAQEQEEALNQEQYDFDASIEQARSEEFKRLHELAMQLLSELDVLLSPPDCYLLKKFKTYFDRKECGPIFYSRDFMGILAEKLETVKLSDEIYSYIISVYNLNGFKYEKLVPEAKQLFDAINKNYAVKKDTVASKRIGLLSGIAGGLLYCLFQFGPVILKALNRAGVDDAIVWGGLAVIVVAGIAVRLINKRKK